MELVDTHCHIQSAGVAAGERATRELWSKAPGLTPDAIIAHADAAGVTRMICVGCDLADSQLAVDFVKDRENCWASVGIHPHEAQQYVGQKATQEAFAALARADKVVAIGECGLDYFYNHSPKAAQIDMLKFQIELALERDLPLIFHVREAYDDFWPVFDSYQGLRGVIHSFSANTQVLEQIVARGLYVGLNGIMTFTKHTEQLEAAKAVPLERLLLETDAPFLTPTPHRGSICEPYHTGVTAGFLSRLRNEPLQELAAATTQNAKVLFRI